MTPSPPLRVEHITQPALLVRSLDTTMDWLHAAFGVFPSERVNIRRAGVHNAVYAFANRTYLELIEPYEPTSSAYRLLQRSGPGWHMLNVDLAHADLKDNDAAIRATGVRIVQTNRTEHITGAWHLHPADTGGVLLNLADPVDHNEHGMWAGWAWREYVGTNTRVVDQILGVSVATRDLAAACTTWSGLGFTFGDPTTDGEDHVAEARCSGGTFLQIRQPRSAASTAGKVLENRGPGLGHLCWGVRQLETVQSHLQTLGVEIERTGQGVFWTTADSTPLAVPMEFRQLDSGLAAAPRR
ncbi:MAG: VOC family protein [Proteobacteria bacterium]|nr:VOC family protein [Pseudomonadota bacterium]MDA1298805.1 VOC family protein [Pseudomonadota bacterium]